MERSLEELRAALDMGKSSFRTTMLDNDVFYGVVHNFLTSSDADSANLPEFGCEPVMTQNEDGTLNWGVRFGTSCNNSSEGINVSFSTFKYLPIAKIDMQCGDSFFDEKFTAELEKFDTMPEKMERLGVLESWRSGYNAIVRNLKDEATWDPAQGTIVLKRDLENTFVQSLDPTIIESSPGALMQGMDWQTNITSDPDSEDFVIGRGTIAALRQLYGGQNVIVSMLSNDYDTLLPTRVTGKLGVYVVKGSRRLDLE
jgi:hypothetical protein